jgi:hypothetical protein
MNDVWYSTDGVTWTQATAAAGWSLRANFTSVVFDNKIWVMGGTNGTTYYNDVWYSTDGVTWTQATASAGWSGRVGLRSVVFDNKMWVMAGYNGTTYYNDVWYSTNGVNWICATSAASWITRHSPGAVVHDQKIWVMGGYTGSYRNDVWYSTGLNGVEEESSTLDASRNTLKVFPNPVSSFFIIRTPLNSQSSILRIFDVTGNIVKSEELKGKNNRISLDGIKNGVYFVKVGDEMEMRKLVILK